MAYWQGGLIESGGGGGGVAYFKLHIFDEIHNNFPYFTIIPITKTAQENGFFITILQMQRNLYLVFVASENKDQVSKESDWNDKKYC